MTLSGLQTSFCHGKKTMRVLTQVTSVDLQQKNPQKNKEENKRIWVRELEVINIFALKL